MLHDEEAGVSLQVCQRHTEIQPVGQSAASVSDEHTGYMQLQSCGCRTAGLHGGGYLQTDCRLERLLGSALCDPCDASVGKPAAKDSGAAAGGTGTGC